MQTLRKKTSPLKYRNEPARFFGDGVVFKAKLIGILEVGEARGDRMCQEALQDLKIAIRAAGEHKQRITIHVTIEGLRLRDEKTGESLYHHPVHKISFIAQDMTDSRAFGYIYGSPDCGHRFFGIKTDKAASQVVLAMRDLFQCVFELKKKEIELAKQHIQNRIIAHEHQQIKSSILEQKKTTASSSLLSDTVRSKPEKSPEATANLVDLEQELSSIQRGITQMERITPNDDQPPNSLIKSVLVSDDPFGDSFTTNFSSLSSTPFNIPPPPTSSSKRQTKTSIDEDDGDLSSIIRKSATPPITTQQSSSSPFQANLPLQSSSNLDSWFTNADDSGINNNQKSFNDSNNLNNDTKSELIGTSFTDLDPLGTGKSKPYVDKKYFFQDLKNPPKKILKDLSEHESIFDAHFSPLKTNQQLKSSSLDSSNNFSKMTEKVIDPFDEEDFSKINVDQLETTVSMTAAKPPISPNQKSIILPDTKISSLSTLSSTAASDKPKISDHSDFHLTAADDSWTSDHYRRQTSMDNASKNVFSVATKKLQKPNLFGQRNVKRDSNGINMRRLQESDSLSENEPELPPRLPDSSSYEPPPLPPKNPSAEYNGSRYYRTQSSSSGSRYDYASKLKPYSSDSPPNIPLPSRKINRNESSVSSSLSKSMKKSMDDEDDYLSPNPISADGFPQLPPPPSLQKKDPSKTRYPRKSDTDPKNLDAPTPKSAESGTSILPDITLSQLLTLGIDDLAHKLNVPVEKLNTMTLVELTTYLSDFIERSKQQPSHMMAESPNDSSVFKVSFDEASDAVFEAKFDDNFGNDVLLSPNIIKKENSFIANFDNFNQAPISVIPTADRYAVFREIIDQEQQAQQFFEDVRHQESIESNNSNSLEEVQDAAAFDFTGEFGSNQFESSLDAQFKQSPITANQSSNKITEALSGVKDRYQALRELRNIVLVEDLFDKTVLPPPVASISDSNLSDEIVDDNSTCNQQVFETADNNSLDNVPTYSISWADAEDPDAINNSSTAIDQTHVHNDEGSTGGGAMEEEENQNVEEKKDDLEIDEYMHKTISELSLDQRLSPNIQNKTPTISTPKIEQKLTALKVNDMSTSPLPTNKSPSPIDASPSKEVNEESEKFPNDEKLIPKELTQAESQVNSNNDDNREKTLTPSKNMADDNETGELWANFGDQEEEKIKQPAPKVDHESGSSDGKHDWKQREREYRKRWPKQHTSSSSRDVSPWEEGNHEQKKRSSHINPSHYDRYGRPPVGALGRRRRSSCDDHFDDEFGKRPQMPSRMRSSKGSIHRSKEILEADNPSWYGDDRWYPDDEDMSDRHISHFERNAYERSTYGPPYMIDKREPKNFSYDRRSGFDKRSKYYRYNRPEYDYDPYDVPLAQSRNVNKSRKEYDDYEPSVAFERGSRENRSAREYFFDRDRRSFDSNDSYDSGSHVHRMGSGDIYHDNYRDRYAATKMQRRGQRSRMDDDSEEELPPRRPSGETGSLQRAQMQRSKHGNIKLDDDVWGAVGGGGKWKQRPSSATAERMSGSGGNLSDSDGEKEKKHRRKSRQKIKEVELRSNYATIRHPGSSSRQRDYFDFENDPNDCYDEPRSPGGSGGDGYYRKRPSGNVRTSTTPRMENKSFSEYVKPGYDDYDDRFAMHKSQQHFKKSTSRDLYLDEIERPQKSRYDLPSVHSSVKKFNFDGFESDFNSSSPKQIQHQTSQDMQKFSFEGDFRTSPNPSSASGGGGASVAKSSSSQQKLRFNENVAVSKFDKNSTSQQMFEDDFIESWTPPSDINNQSAMQSSLKKTPMSNLKFSKQENIKKSDSINIFARKSDEDPFANDDFFNSESGNGGGDDNSEVNNEAEDPFQWNSQNNFANFDDNKNI